ncbi:MAG: cytochrome c oxidase subunit 3 [Alphaproteobacteria bacterium CG_4_9_14_3_um_filter_47_13]|nr:MAG: cytochrome c oxidase subunit 3 [Alphaproteobacteria bacterium CG_4_9_14_3_um_filter_47_13]
MMAGQINYSTTGKPHPFHIVRPSAWPFLGALAGGILAAGMVMYMHDISFGDFNVGLKGVVIGLLAVAAIMFVWWKDILHEAVFEKAHTPIAQIGLRYGMALFIASEVMFFVAFFWAFYDASLYAGDANQFLRTVYTGGMWPPPQIEIIKPFELPFLMTMILLLSGCTVTWAHHAILEGKQAESVKALGITVLLGFTFLCFQVFEYAHAAFGFTDGLYASTFFMATGFHGFHVFVGTVFLFVCWKRAKKGHFKPESHFGFEAAAWYWHFVDVVWLFLFISIYWWGNTIGIGHGGL